MNRARTVPPIHVFSGCDVPWLVETQARTRPHKMFLVWEPFEGKPRIWTFEQFNDETRAYAAGLSARGVSEGDFVTIHMDNCPEFLFAWFACSRIGAVAVTTNTGSSLEELRYFISDSGSTVAITQSKYMQVVREAGENLRWIALTAADGEVSLQDSGTEEVLAFEELHGESAKAPIRKSDPMRANSVQYTSGTTSRPKGVVWTHANALWGARVTAGHAQIGSTDVVPVFFPLFHANALAYTVLPTLWSGGTVVLLPKFSGSRFWEIVVRNRCTWANMVHFTIRALQNLPDPPKHYFRFWACLAQLSMVRERWGISVISWYGMTETVTQNIHSPIGFVTPDGAIGRPAHEYEIAIRSKDGADTATGETGRLWVRGIPGLSMFLEYLNHPLETSAAFDSAGWFDTGDEVKIDEDGQIHFVGRAKDMLRVGEENVAASEIESVINRVEGVVECAVVGKPDDMLEEVPVAFVVAREPTAKLEAEIMSMCATALSRFKRPREIHFLDELPKGLLDKTLKRHLRSRL
jgi:crotonobetaine/carnitine-CoA ligase